MQLWSCAAGRDPSPTAAAAFRCKEPGLFADVSSGCEQFHVCHADPGSRPRLVSTQPCPPGTLFDQRQGSCDAEAEVECELLADADQGFGGVARRVTRSLAVLQGVVVEGRRPGRRRRAVLQQTPSALDVYYPDYDALPQPGPAAQSRLLHPTDLDAAVAPPRQVPSVPSTYFQYSDAAAPSSTTERAFNPDDYVDDNYEPFIETNKPATTTVEAVKATAVREVAASSTPAASRPAVTTTPSSGPRPRIDAQDADPSAVLGREALRGEDPYLAGRGRGSANEYVEYLQDDASLSTQPPNTQAGVPTSTSTSKDSDKPTMTLDPMTSKSATAPSDTKAETSDRIGRPRSVEVRQEVAPLRALSTTSTTPSTTSTASGDHRFRVADNLLRDDTSTPSATLTSSATTTQAGLLNHVPSTPPPSPPPVPLDSQRRPFVCAGRELKAFHDDTTDCRMFHYCSPGFSRGQLLDFRFRCEKGTVYQRDANRCAPGSCTLA